MVPHRKALRAIALASRCAVDSAVELERLCALHEVKFPCTFEHFWKTEVLDYLTDEQEIQLTTTDVNLTQDYRPVLTAAAQLGVANLLALTETGLTLNVSRDCLKWRKQRSIRIAIEVLLLCGVSIAQVSEDMRSMYQTQFSADDLTQYASVYCDVEYTVGEYWANYEESIGKSEATYKARFMQQPVDFVRHSLGVAVRLEPDQVLNRLMSDSYFTCLQIQSDNDGELGKDELARVKFERDTIFKAMDRLTKHKEASGGNSSTKAADAISKIVMTYEDTSHKMLSELLDDNAGQSSP